MAMAKEYIFSASCGHDTEISWYACRVSRTERRRASGTVRNWLTQPKADLMAALAQALDVAPQALDIPDIDSYIGLMHTFICP